MENSELLYELKQIDNITNELDRIVALKQFEKRYKKSKFYKQTKMPLRALYANLIGLKFDKMITGIMQNFNIDSLANTLTEILDGVDTDSLNNFFVRLSDIMDPNQLAASAVTLQEQIQKLQR